MDRKFCDVSLNYKEVVALRKESVDRKSVESGVIAKQFVALRKESVDRKACAIRHFENTTLSLSARRAWIEKMQ